MKMGQVVEAITRPSRQQALNEVINRPNGATYSEVVVVLSELISTIYHQIASNRGTRNLCPVSGWMGGNEIRLKEVNRGRGV